MAVVLGVLQIVFSAVFALSPNGWMDYFWLAFMPLFGVLWILYGVRDFPEGVRRVLYAVACVGIAVAWFDILSGWLS